MVDKCTCSGAVCTCGALGVVKDGSAVRVSGLMMDSATTDAGTPMSIADRAASSKYDDVRGCIVGGMEASVYYATIDAADGTPEAQRAIAHRDAAYEKMLTRDAEAWQGNAVQKASVADSLTSENNQVRDQAFADAKASGMDDASAQAHASYEAMCHRDSNAWRGV